MSDFEFMTYDAAAERLQIAVSSVKRQAARRKWPKRRGNDGRVTVGIPVSRLSADSPSDCQRDDVPKTDALIQSLRDLVESERRRADAAESDRDAWREMAQRPWWRRLIA